MDREVKLGSNITVRACLRVCVCVCVRACVRACVGVLTPVTGRVDCFGCVCALQTPR